MDRHLLDVVNESSKNKNPKEGQKPTIDVEKYYAAVAAAAAAAAPADGSPLKSVEELGLEGSSDDGEEGEDGGEEEDNDEDSKEKSERMKEQEKHDSISDRTCVRCGKTFHSIRYLKVLNNC